MTRPTKNLTGPIATGDALHFGSNDLDQVNYLFTGQDQSATDPIDMNTSWKYRDQKLVLRDPTNTHSLKFRNPAIGADYDYQLNTPYDMYVFIDLDDSNKIKCKDGRTGAIISSDATNANVPLQAAIDTLSARNVLPPVGDNSGNMLGTILVGPGIYYLHTAVILRSNLTIRGSGVFATIFTWPDNLLLGNHNQDFFKSYYWDINSYGANGTSNTQLALGDFNITLKNFQIYGNYQNNLIPDANTATTTGLGTVASPETAGSDSWGHGIALYGCCFNLENLFVRECPGAGIILQGGNSTVGGGGWPYPVNTFTGYGGAAGRGWMDPISTVYNVQCVGNGRQGLLARTMVYVDTYWSYFNGEAGIDCQACDYFSGWGWINRIQIFSDGYKHGAAYAPQKITYDPLGFEMRISVNGVWMNDDWLAGPLGTGDMLMIGAAIGAPASPSGYQLSTAAVNHMIENSYFATVKAAGIYLAGSNCHIKNAHVELVSYQGGARNPYPDVTPLKVMGSYNDVELSFRGFNQGALLDTGGPIQGTINGVIIGDPAAFVWGNKLTIFSTNNDIVITNRHSNNRSDVRATITDTTASTKYLWDPASVTPAIWADNNIEVSRIGHWASSTSNVQSHNGGVAQFNGTGSQLTFQIPHLLFTTPNVISVVPNNGGGVTGALGNYLVNADATNITITYIIAPPSGTNNVKFSWNARVSP